ncbi:hypothetical protein ABZ517_09690 [Streptomyces scabiei]|uniref:hypothetical protein n=1 Tax=Streptomyces scabiei TaxID=1930 RepID=UPI0033F81CCD
MADLASIAAEIMASCQSLDEDATARHHFRHADQECGPWSIEAVPDRGDLNVIQQAELTLASQLHRYNWAHLDDGWVRLS